MITRKNLIKLPYIKWKDGKIGNLVEIEKWMRFNCLEVGAVVCADKVFDSYRTEELWEIIWRLVQTKESLINCNTNLVIQVGQLKSKQIKP